MAIKTAPVELKPVAKPKPARKATAKPVEAAPVVDTVQTTPEPSLAVVEASNGKKRGGFASMTAERHKALSSKGGTSQPREKRWFSQNPDKAREAASRGGKISRKGTKNAEI